MRAASRRRGVGIRNVSERLRAAIIYSREGVGIRIGSERRLKAVIIYSRKMV